MNDQSTMHDYRVELDAYSGPLDLLLYLVRRHEIDLHNIPIARLTQQYIEYLKLIQHIDVELASEFLVMAATLLEIKSAMLLPRPVEDADAQEPKADSGLDPRYELIQQLLAYKRFKDAAAELEARRDEWARRYPYRPVKHRPAANGDDPDTTAETIEVDLEDANVLDLCKAYARVLETVGRQPAMHEVVYDDTPISLHAEDIVDRLTRDGAVTLQELFVGRENRSEKIGLFLATLELIRQARVDITLNEASHTLRLELRDPDDQTTTDNQPPEWRDPETGEIQYDWPTEEARLRAERLTRLRANRKSRPVTDNDHAHTTDADESTPSPSNERGITATPTEQEPVEAKP